MMSRSEAAKCVLNKRGTLWEDREVDALIATKATQSVASSALVGRRKLQFSFSLLSLSTSCAFTVVPKLLFLRNAVKALETECFFE